MSSACCPSCTSWRCACAWAVRARPPSPPTPRALAEDEELILKPMAETAHEPIGSMGDDTPIAAFSAKPQLVYRYFKQKFAEVTNPPIDPLLERSVMSLNITFGACVRGAQCARV